MITPVILCGGSGTRLWPLSRASYPKQFGRLLGEKSLFQASVAAAAGAGVRPAGDRHRRRVPLHRHRAARRHPPRPRRGADRARGAQHRPRGARRGAEPRGQRPGRADAGLPLRPRDPRRSRLPGRRAGRRGGGRGRRARHLRRAPDPAGDRLRLSRADRGGRHGRPARAAAAGGLRREARRRHRRGDAGRRPAPVEQRHLPVLGQGDRRRLRDPPAGDAGCGARGAGRGHRRPRLPAARPRGLGRGRDPLDRLRGDGEGRQPRRGPLRRRLVGPRLLGRHRARHGDRRGRRRDLGPRHRDRLREQPAARREPRPGAGRHRPEERRRHRDARRGAGRRHHRRPAGQGGGGAPEVAAARRRPPSSRATTGPGAGTRRCRSATASR